MFQKIRTIDECIKEIKECDPQTQFTKHALRQMVIKGLIPSVRVGCKYLISLETLETFLQGDIIRQQTSQGGNIRQINERL